VRLYILSMGNENWMRTVEYQCKNQLLFFSVLLLSAFGYEFIYFIMTVHIYELSKSALNIGIFTTLTFIPRLFSSLMGGISDKHGKERCFAVSAVLIGILMLFMSHVRSMTAIYTIWFIASIFFTVIVNSRGALMAEVVSGDRYRTGNALTLSMLNAAKLLGPLFGGLIIMNSSVKTLFYFIGLVFFSVAICSFQIKTGTPDVPGNKPGFLVLAKQGFRFMAENKTFGMLSSIAFFWRLCLGLQFSLFVIYVKSFLDCSSQQYGFFITLTGLGSIAGSLLGPYIAKRMKPLPLIAGGLGFHYASFRCSWALRELLPVPVHHLFQLCILLLGTGYDAFRQRPHHPARNTGKRLWDGNGPARPARYCINACGKFLYRTIRRGSRVVFSGRGGSAQFIRHFMSGNEKRGRKFVTAGLRQRLSMCRNHYRSK